jgi:hypothetical protein
MAVAGQAAKIDHLASRVFAPFSRILLNAPLVQSPPPPQAQSKVAAKEAENAELIQMVETLLAQHEAARTGAAPAGDTAGAPDQQA